MASQESGYGKQNQGSEFDLCLEGEVRSFTLEALYSLNSLTRSKMEDQIKLLWETGEEKDPLIFLQSFFSKDDMLMALSKLIKGSLSKDILETWDRFIACGAHPDRGIEDRILWVLCSEFKPVLFEASKPKAQESAYCVVGLIPGIDF